MRPQITGTTTLYSLSACASCLLVRPQITGITAAAAEADRKRPALSGAVSSANLRVHLSMATATALVEGAIHIATAALKEKVRHCSRHRQSHSRRRWH